MYLKIIESIFENQKIVQIYLHYSETKEKNIIEKIDEIKREFKNVAIFISGKDKTINAVKEILNYEKRKDIK